MFPASSSISSSEPPPDPTGWRRFLRIFAGTALGLGLAAYLFIVTVDPWGMLPLSPSLPRAPISTNARFSMPMLATSPRFDAAIIGTSTSRLLRPAALDRLLGAHFVNLAMNSATPWEQGRMLALFARHHPDPKVVVIGLDSAWCLARADSPRLTGRPFPEWMYGDNRWRGYLHVANLYALQEAANQFMMLVGARRSHYGADGYTDFLPAENRYDAARVDRIFRQWGQPSTDPAASRPTDPAALSILARLLPTLPSDTIKILYMPPIADEELGTPGSWIAAKWQSCRDGATRIAQATPNTVLVDFAYRDPVTTTRSNFWDPVHYRVPIADRVMQAIAQAATTGDAAPGDIDRVLVSRSLVQEGDRK
ncbi:hypothetical protein [Lichenicola sp.]|uniref:hypothetical protein n=1 Tax=Lichenicola sp. TaxID=2804529 RepID=UPI003B002ED9